MKLMLLISVMIVAISAKVNAFEKHPQCTSKDLKILIGTLEDSILSNNETNETIESQIALLDILSNGTSQFRCSAVLQSHVPLATACELNAHIDYHFKINDVETATDYSVIIREEYLTCNEDNHISQLVSFNKSLAEEICTKEFGFLYNPGTQQCSYYTNGCVKARLLDSGYEVPIDRNICSL